jgi:hypothetical protein
MNLYHRRWTHSSLRRLGNDVVVSFGGNTSCGAKHSRLLNVLRIRNGPTLCNSGIPVLLVVVQHADVIIWRCEVDFWVVIPRIDDIQESMDGFGLGTERLDDSQMLADCMVCDE